ncbi:MAG: hypothetical protein ABI445_21940 [Polyangia bacterium]
MLNLPNNGDRVRIWPVAERVVQVDHRPIHSEHGGRACDADGQDVVWSTFLLESYRAGDFYLHDPTPQAAGEAKAAKAAKPEPEHPAPPEPDLELELAAAVAPSSYK